MTIAADARPQRSAWLTFADGTGILALDDFAAGYACLELDLGFPDVRDVVNNRPDQNGVDDRTSLVGSRVVTASMVAFGGTLNADQAVRLFAPYLDPSIRPQLHYLVGDGIERILTLRATKTASVLDSKPTRAFQLSWVAPDPTAYGGVVNTVTAWAGSSTASGRAYDLSFDRTYPTGGGTPVTGRIRPRGDLGVAPLLRIYGPITAPRVYFAIHPAAATQVNAYVQFVTGFVLGVNEWVDVDTNAKTAYRQSDPTQSVFSSINFASTVWPVLPPNPTGAGIPYTDMSLLGSGAMSGTTQVQAMWRDAYLA
jgi:hypothetical protein